MKPAGMSQTAAIVLRIMAAGDGGVLTADLFRDLACAKYTSRISELRAQGHQIEASKENTLAGGIPTEQWRYRYCGFQRDLQKLSPIVRAAFEKWHTNQKKQLDLIPR